VLECVEDDEFLVDGGAGGAGAGCWGGGLGSIHCVMPPRVLEWDGQKTNPLAGGVGTCPEVVEVRRLPVWRVWLGCVCVCVS
jgi:hypothetical protein